MTYRKLNREKEVESYLVKRMADIGLHTYKFIPDNRIGMPDRLLTLPDGRVLWIELKTDNGHLSMVQKLRHKELRDDGQNVEVIWNRKDVDALVERIREETGCAESCT